MEVMKKGSLAYPGQRATKWVNSQEWELASSTFADDTSLLVIPIPIPILKSFKDTYAVANKGKRTQECPPLL